MAIDWNLLQPIRGNGPEIASISNLLGAFAENRMKQKQMAEEQAFRERQFAAQQANIAADNARADQQLQMQQAQQQAAAEHQRKELERQQAETFAQKALPGAQAALRNNDIQGARLAVQPYGGDITQDYTKGKAADAAVQERKASAADMGDSLKALMPYSPALAGLPQNLVAGANAAAQPTADETRQMAPRYKIQPPVGSALDFSPSDIDEAERVAGERSAKTIGDVTAGMQLPYSSRVLGVSQALARIPGMTPKEAIEKGVASGQFAEGEASRERNAAMMAARARESHQDVESDRNERRGIRAEGALNTETDKWASQNGIKELNKAKAEAGRALTLAGSTNGPAQTAAVEGFIKAARGGAVTAASQGFATKHLGGLLDQLEGKVQAAKDGRFSPSQMANLRAGLKATVGALQEELDTKEKQFNGRFRSGRYSEVEANIDDIAEGMFGSKPIRKKGAQGITPTGKKYTSKSGTLEDLDAEADSLLGGR